MVRLPQLFPPVSEVEPPLLEMDEIYRSGDAADDIEADDVEEDNMEPELEPEFSLASVPEEEPEPVDAPPPASSSWRPSMSDSATQTDKRLPPSKSNRRSHMTSFLDHNTGENLRDRAHHRSSVTQQRGAAHDSPSSPQPASSSSPGRDRSPPPGRPERKSVMSAAKTLAKINSLKGRRLTKAMGPRKTKFAAEVNGAEDGRGGRAQGLMEAEGAAVDEGKDDEEGEEEMDMADGLEMNVAELDEVVSGAVQESEALREVESMLTGPARVPLSDIALMVQKVTNTLAMLNQTAMETTGGILDTMVELAEIEQGQAEDGRSGTSTWQAVDCVEDGREALHSGLEAAQGALKILEEGGEGASRDSILELITCAHQNLEIGSSCLADGKEFAEELAEVVRDAALDLEEEMQCAALAGVDIACQTEGRPRTEPREWSAPDARFSAAVVPPRGLPSESSTDEDAMPFVEDPPSVYHGAQVGTRRDDAEDAGTSFVSIQDAAMQGDLTMQDAAVSTRVLMEDDATSDRVSVQDDATSDHRSVLNTAVSAASWDPRESEGGSPSEQGMQGGDGSNTLEAQLSYQSLGNASELESEHSVRGNVGQSDPAEQESVEEEAVEILEESEGQAAAQPKGSQGGRVQEEMVPSGAGQAPPAPLQEGSELVAEVPRGEMDRQPGEKHKGKKAQPTPHVDTMHPTRGKAYGRPSRMSHSSVVEDMEGEEAAMAEAVRPWQPDVEAEVPEMAPDLPIPKTSDLPIQKTPPGGNGETASKPDDGDTFLQATRPAGKPEQKPGVGLAMRNDGPFSAAQKEFKPMESSGREQSHPGQVKLEEVKKKHKDLKVQFKQQSVALQQMSSVCAAQGKELNRLKAEKLDEMQKAFSAKDQLEMQKEHINGAKSNLQSSEQVLLEAEKKVDHMKSFVAMSKKAAMDLDLQLENEQATNRGLTHELKLANQKIESLLNNSEKHSRALQAQVVAKEQQLLETELRHGETMRQNSVLVKHQIDNMSEMKEEKEKARLELLKRTEEMKHMKRRMSTMEMMRSEVPERVTSEKWPAGAQRGSSVTPDDKRTPNDELMKAKVDFNVPKSSDSLPPTEVLEAVPMPRANMSPLSGPSEPSAMVGLMRPSVNFSFPASPPATRQPASTLEPGVPALPPTPGAAPIPLDREEQMSEPEHDTSAADAEVVEITATDSRRSLVQFEGKPHLNEVDHIAGVIDKLQERMEQIQPECNIPGIEHDFAQLHCDMVFILDKLAEWKQDAGDDEEMLRGTSHQLTDSKVDLPPSTACPLKPPQRGQSPEGGVRARLLHADHPLAG
ncbi:hypothetical protein CYMTET_51425 [Cymbomonas tetramitiformis]|uniref:Uncharacterized protein n=1 Tax=Cymbomonas tetramitiformis TaxID=36881 RepID=A0AAE0BMA8_9CHLO|nr:hypothetical protein CYMTET_51425 [Cymbomonas tetramitiformis]